jgi:hypothetical protein
VLFDGGFKLRDVAAVLFDNIEDYQDYAKDEELQKEAVNDKTQNERY